MSPDSSRERNAVYELAHRGGGIGVAAMCAGRGQGGAVIQV
jgi:acetyl-CoA acetyltransferase